MNALRRLKLVHLLVAIALFGVLMGLMLPAQHLAREASHDESRQSATAAKMGGGGLGGGGSGYLERQIPGTTLNEPGSEMRYATALQVDDAAAEAGVEGDRPDQGAAGRNIIYEAQMSVVVEDLAATENAINKLMAEFGGYAAESSVARQQGEQLSGHWRVRIPIARFTEFMDAVAELGVAETRQQTAQDVTEEFVDLTARIANKKRLEERIVELLASATGKITDVIQVEQELARPRRDRADGRPPAISHQPHGAHHGLDRGPRGARLRAPGGATFASRITQSWHDSLAELQSFGERLSIAAVAAAPWIAMIGALLLPLAWLLRKFARRHTHGNVPPATAAATS